MSTLTTIPSIVDGVHPDGTTVTVTGQVNNIDQNGFLLISPETAVRVHLDPAYSRYWRLLIAAQPPLTLTVTGRVDSRERVPVLVATRIARADLGGAR